MINIIQPYYTWNGHYKKYTDALLSGGDTYLIYSDLFSSHPKNVIIFSLARVFNSLITLYKLFIRKCKSSDTILNVEFEPFTFFLILFFSRKKKISLLQTIHSIEKVTTSSKIQTLLASLQRKVFQFAIKKIKNDDLVKIVVHSELHKEQLIRLNQQLSVFVLEYPCDSKKNISNKRAISSFPIKVLIFGMMRKDKGIYEFLSKLHDEFYEKIELTLAGKVYDERILAIENKKFILINQFLDDDDINKLMLNSHFSLLPYPTSYTGGAGPLRDSASFGLPVICSKIPLFDEMNTKYLFCIQYESIKDIILDVERVVFTDEYELLSKNALDFSRKNSWDIFSGKYLSLAARS